MRSLFGYFGIIFLLVSCGSPDANNAETLKVFRYNEAAGITSLDPAFSRTFENLWAVNQMYEGLVELDSLLRVKPLIAKRWTVSSDGLTYTFYLRNDVFFHSNNKAQGRQVLASDFEYSFKRIIDPVTASPGQWVFSRVADDGISALNDSTLEIKLSEAFPPFLGILSMKYCSVVPREMVEKYGLDFRSHPVGTGPFKFNFWAEGQMLALIRNEHYYIRDEYGVPLPYLDGVGVTFNRDLNAVFLEFLKGKYSIIQGAEGEYMEELLNPSGQLRALYQPNIRLEKSPWLKTDYLGILIDSTRLSPNHPLLDLRVREALNRSIDRQMLTEKLLYGLASPANGGFLPQGFRSHGLAENAYKFDLEHARQLIDEAGYDSENPLNLTLSTTATHANLGQFLQHQWAKIGVELEIEILESGNLNQSVAQGNVALFKKSWLADYPDEENFMALFYGPNWAPSGPNYTHFEHESVDILYEKALKLTDSQVRSAYYGKMDSLVSLSYPVIPLYYGQAVKFSQKRIQGLTTDAVNMLDLRRVDWK